MSEAATNDEAAPSREVSDPKKGAVLNVPNALSSLRLLLACVVFALTDRHFYVPAIVIFIIAAGTDWIDGWWARKFDQVTQVGRMLDPFVDKIIICGAFISLAAQSHLGSGVAAWMATVVVGRELLVTALRSMIEASGGDFSAGMSGKLKMVFQCIAVVASLIALHYGDGNVPNWLSITLFIAVLVAVLSTIQSGIGYVFAAAKMSRQKTSS